jgi:hypothetical protein
MNSPVFGTLHNLSYVSAIIFPAEVSRTVVRLILNVWKVFTQAFEFTIAMPRQSTVAAQIIWKNGVL